MNIPDLEDDNTAGGRGAAISQAPISNMEDMDELNKKLSGNLPSTLEGGIDLSIIHSFIRGKSELIEPDTEWTYKSLQNEIQKTVY